MYGTLAGALAARHVEFDRSRYTAQVEGFIEGTDRSIKISRIVLHYQLAVPRAQRKETDRALETHPLGCPAHESVKGAIEVSWDAVVEDL